MMKLMKLVPVKVLALATLVLTFSCKTTIDYAKKYPNMVANVDPIIAGSIEAQFNPFITSKLKKSDVEVVFYPRLNMVALEFRYELIKYKQFWDLESRKLFVEALEQYKAEYEARELITRDRKTRAKYGKFQGRVEWITFKYSTTRIAYPPIELGYRFKNKMPYFSVLMRSAREEAHDGITSTNGESLQINMFFTRAQAEDLAVLFDQDFLMGLLGAKKDPTAEDPDLDPYTEHEDN